MMLANGEPNHPAVVQTSCKPLSESDIRAIVDKVQRLYPINKAIYINFTYRRTMNSHAYARGHRALDTACITLNLSGMNLRTVLHELTHIILDYGHGHDCTFQFEFIKLCQWYAQLA